MMPMTSLELLYEAGACAGRYKFLAKALGGITKYGKDTPITLLQILDINGLDDTLWALRACPGSERFSRLLACDYAEHVLHAYETRYPNDDRPQKAIETSRRYAYGKATMKELKAAWKDARSATWESERSTAYSAVLSTVWGVSITGHFSNMAFIGQSAAEYAARSTAGRAAGAASQNAEQQWQEERLRELLKEME